METLLSWEETERARRSLERRLRCAHTLITTNKAFSEWSEVFPNASCVVAMIDRLVHHAEIIPIELLDDLRNRIWAHYAIALSEEYRNQFAPVSGVEPMVSPDTDDPPF